MAGSRVVGEAGRTRRCNRPGAPASSPPACRAPSPGSSLPSRWSYLDPLLMTL